MVQIAYDRKQISQSCYENLMDRFANDLDELDRNYADLIHSIQNAEYYFTLDRITKGEELLEIEQDPAKKSEYRKLLNDLTIKLESMSPKGESA